MDEQNPIPAPTPVAPTPPQSGQPEPAFVDFAVGGEVYKLDARLAARLAQDTNTPSAYAPPAQPAHMQPQVAQAPQQAEPELHELIFRDPRTAINRIKDDLRAEMTAAYRQEQATQNFWSSLYRTDESMRRVPREFVNAVVMENQRAFAGLPDEIAIKRVADLVKERIASFSGLGQNTQQQVPTSYADGGSTPAPAPAAPEPEGGEPQTLSELIRQKREARRKGMSS